MYEELLKAYNAGADRYWLLNVGDIKPMEMETQMFMDMAYDFQSFSYDNANTYQTEWLAKRRLVREASAAFSALFLTTIIVWPGTASPSSWATR